VHKQRKHRTTILCIVVRFWNVLKNFCYWKNRSTIFKHRTTIWRSVWGIPAINEASYYAFKHRSTIFVNQNFSYKSQVVLWAKGWKFWKKKRTFGAGDLERRWETIKAHIRLPILCNESFFHISYLCFSHE